MDYFRQDSAHVTNQFSIESSGSTADDKLTRKHWVRGLLAFYICLLFAGATAIGASQFKASSTDAELHASLRANTR
jgi:hypothetical protein